MRGRLSPLAAPGGGPVISTQPPSSMAAQGDTSSDRYLAISSALSSNIQPLVCPPTCSVAAISKRGINSVVVMMLRRDEGLAFELTPCFMFLNAL